MDVPSLGKPTIQAQVILSDVSLTFHKCTLHICHIYSVFWDFPWREKVIFFIPAVLIVRAGAFILKNQVFCTKQLMICPVQLSSCKPGEKQCMVKDWRYNYLRKGETEAVTSFDLLSHKHLKCHYYSRQLTNSRSCFQACPCARKWCNNQSKEPMCTNDVIINLECTSEMEPFDFSLNFW